MNQFVTWNHQKRLYFQFSWNNIWFNFSSALSTRTWSLNSPIPYSIFDWLKRRTQPCGGCACTISTSLHINVLSFPSRSGFSYKQYSQLKHFENTHVLQVSSSVSYFSFIRLFHAISLTFGQTMCNRTSVFVFILYESVCSICINLMQ